MFLRFTRKIRPLHFKILKPCPFQVEEIFLNPLQITHVSLNNTRVEVYLAGDYCYSKESPTPQLAIEEFERINREMKFSLSQILKDSFPEKPTTPPIRWDMPSPDPLAVEELK
jgi:hypothetical protein